MSEILNVYRKVLKVLEALPFSADIVSKKINADKSFDDILRIFAIHQDYELRNNALSLLRKWSLPCPVAARRATEREYRGDRSEDRADHGDVYRRPHEVFKRSRGWEGSSGNGREWDRGGRGEGSRNWDRDSHRLGIHRTDYRDGRWDDSGNWEARNGRKMDDESIPFPPADGPEFSPMTEDEQEDGIIVVGGKDDAHEDVFAHGTGDLIRDPFDDASNGDGGAPVSMVFVSAGSWTSPHDPGFDKFVTSCCQKELAKHEGPMLTRAEATSLFKKIRREIIDGEKKAYAERSSSGATQHILDEKKVRARVKQFVKEKVDRFKSQKKVEMQVHD